MGAGLLAVKSGFILFIKSYQFPLQINTLERETMKQLSVYSHFFAERHMTQLSSKKILPPGPHEVFVPEKGFKLKNLPPGPDGGHGLSNTWTTKSDTKRPRRHREYRGQFFLA